MGQGGRRSLPSRKATGGTRDFVRWEAMEDSEQKSIFKMPRLLWGEQGLGDVWGVVCLEANRPLQ